MDIALKFRVPGKLLCLLQNRIVASGLDDTALMEGQGTEITAAKAAPVADQAVFHLVDGRNAAQSLIGGMIGAHIGKIIHVVHLLLV